MKLRPEEMTKADRFFLCFLVKDAVNLTGQSKLHLGNLDY